MKLKNNTIFYIVGFLLAFLTFIPPMPRILEYLLCLIPILYFGADLTVKYMNEFFAGRYFNRFLCGIIATVGLIAAGRLAYAAMTVILYSAANFYFDTVLKTSGDRIDSACEINAPFARAVMDSRAAKVSVNSVVPGQTLLLKEGDIIPCECSVISGEILVDYTNIFGNGTPKAIKEKGSCFSGGIVQSGTAYVRAEKTVKDSVVTAINTATKKAHAPSLLMRKLKGWARLFEIGTAGLAVLLFVIYIIAAKDFGRAMNVASVFLIISCSSALTLVLPALCHNTVLSARRRGVIFANMQAVEKCGGVQTVSLNEKASPELLTKIEETGAIPARGGSTRYDAVLYRDRATLEGERNPAFKLALGFTSKKADAFCFEPKAERIVGALRSAKNHRSIFLQNLLIIGVEKLALILLALLLNLTPAAAVVVEFAAWMLCLFNATREY